MPWPAQDSARALVSSGARIPPAALHHCVNHTVIARVARVCGRWLQGSSSAPLPSRRFLGRIGHLADSVAVKQ